jgi:hypothetical protein
MRTQHVGDPLGKFAARLLVEIEADREELRGLADRVGAGSNELKGLGAWVKKGIGWLSAKSGPWLIIWLNGMDCRTGGLCRKDERPSSQ